MYRLANKVKERECVSPIRYMFGDVYSFVGIHTFFGVTAAWWFNAWVDLKKYTPGNVEGTV